MRQLSQRESEFNVKPCNRSEAQRNAARRSATQRDAAQHRGNTMLSKVNGKLPLRSVQWRNVDASPYQQVAVENIQANRDVIRTTNTHRVCLSAARLWFCSEAEGEIHKQLNAQHKKTSLACFPVGAIFNNKAVLARSLFFISCRNSRTKEDQHCTWAAVSRRDRVAVCRQHVQAGYNPAHRRRLVCFASTVETVNADALYVQWCIIHDVFSGAELGEKVQNMEGTERTVRL